MWFRIRLRRELEGRMKANDVVEKNNEGIFILKTKTIHTYLNIAEKVKGKRGNAA